MRIGIFGGSFNPPHVDHKQIAIELIEKDYLDKVIFVPTGDKYQKKELISANMRINMLQLMCKNNLNLEVSDYEIKNKLTYTYETLDYFKNKYPNDTIYFICGSDNLKEFKTWKNYEYILDNYKIIVTMRNNDKIDSIIKDINSKNIIEVNIKTNNISSTMIRAKLDEKYLDESVYNYIKKYKLYI